MHAYISRMLDRHICDRMKIRYDQLEMLQRRALMLVKDKLL